MVEIAHRYTDFECTRARSAVFWKALRYGVGSGIAFAVILHVSQVMTNHTYHFSFSWIMLVIHLLQTAIMVCLFYYIFGRDRSEEHTSELQSLMRISYAVFCLKKKNT